MDSKMISSQVIIKPQQNVATKIMVGNGQNFKRIPDLYERPLMVNAWCQTTNDDFQFLYDFEHKQEHTKRENELLEKIRILEENLKAHTELLSQIHATSARTSALLGQSTASSSSTTMTTTEQHSVKPIQIQTIESQSSNVTSYKVTEPSPRLVKSTHNSPTSSVINPLHSIPATNTESIKYTIIAEGTGDAHGEPIEIQLAEDDGALNLNNSADSDRLEICLASDEMEIKTETVTTLPTTTTITPLSRNTTSGGEQNYLKRRRLPADENEEPNENSNYDSTQRRHSKYGGNISLTNIKTENSYSTPKQQSSPLPSGNGDVEYKLNMDNVMVSIGPNNTRIPAKIYESMNWSSASIATRKLLMAIFDRKTLATHSMTGKPSPAFKDHGKPLKQMLDPLAIQDIIFAVTRKCNVSEKEVRNAITTKCADENKMMKLQLNKRTPMREISKKENIAINNNMMV
ncbi:protein insensitive-like [Musca autumnalis]|uniref:protein insensitive-like n=1 Tax=Musca autumnalis TaxID=221902 RepID=UPI003CF71506